MEDSDTHLMILDEGQEQYARKALLVAGEKRLGPADASVRAQLDRIRELERLDRMFHRAFEAGSWQEILATP